MSLVIKGAREFSESRRREGALWCVSLVPPANQVGLGAVSVSWRVVSKQDARNDERPPQPICRVPARPNRQPLCATPLGPGAAAGPDAGSGDGD